MSRFVAHLAGVIFFLVASLAAQDVTLSARVRLMENDKPAQHTNAEGVVIWLSPIDAHVPPKPFPGGPLKLTQHNKSFQPHLLVVPVGAVVQFPNRDPFFHNVFSLFEGKRFDLGLYEAGTTREVHFTKPGVSYIFCNIHPEMSAVVISIPTPYYAISDAQGEIIIPNVNIGRYTLHFWHRSEE